MRRAVLILSILSLFLFPSAVLAAADDAGAAALKKQVEDALRWRLDMGKSTGKGISMGGPVAVTPKGDLYEVTLPQITVLMGPQGRLEVGNVMLKATPKAEGEYATELVLPKDSVFYNAANKQTFTISLGSQNFSGIWRPGSEAWPQVNAVYKDIAIKSAAEKNPITGKIETLTVKGDLKDDGNGLWSGPVEFAGTGISIGGTGESGVELKLGHMSWHASYDKLNMGQSAKMRRDMEEMFAEGKKPGEKEFSGLLKQLTETAGSAAGMKSGFELRGFSFETRSADPAVPARKIVFDKIAFAGESKGLQQDKAFFGVKSSLTGLRVTGLPEGVGDMIPLDTNVDVLAENLPFKKIVEAITASLQKSVHAATAPDATPESRKKAAQEGMTELKTAVPKILQDAGMTVTVKDTFAKGGTLEADFAGKMTANAASPFGMTGRQTLSLKGMDETIKHLQEMAVKPDASPQLMGYISGLTVLQVMGQPSTSADGKSLRNFTLELTPDGKLLLNGADIKMIMPLFSKAVGAAPAPSAETPVTPKLP